MIRSGKVERQAHRADLDYVANIASREKSRREKRRDSLEGAYDEKEDGEHLGGSNVTRLLVPESRLSSTVELGTLATSGAGFTLNGAYFGGRSGYSVSGAGDVNGDGFDDVIIGAYDADPSFRTNAGQSYAECV